MLIAAFAPMILAACLPVSSPPQTASGTGAIIYHAAAVVTMEEELPRAEAVAVREGVIISVGGFDELVASLPGASLDRTFIDHVIAPGFIDPHVHMDLSSIEYALPIAPPWEMAGPDGAIEGLPTREAYLARLREIEAATPAGEPLIIYGFHDLVHGDLDRSDLDAISTDRPLIIWHYSAHDFYLNSAALELTGITADMHGQYEGIALDADGDLTGRIFEDAIPLLLPVTGPMMFAPDILARGMSNFSGLLRRGGVTTVADLGYGIFDFSIVDANISTNWVSPQHSGYRLYLVPEHRAFAANFGDDRVQVILDMVSGARETPAPVLPQVKFFTDAAFYSQTMRISPPGYLSGQSEGSEGLWVLQPEDIAPTIQPYWDADLDVHIHSNGDAAQTATLDALETFRTRDTDNRFVFEHAGLFSPEQVVRAADLDAAISAASHYVHYLGEAYQGPLGEERGSWISPLNSLSEAGVPVTVHSDAPLAQPLPLRAASVHMTRATREGGVLTPSERLSANEALEAITIDAAYALRLESEIGSITAGKRADFTILSANPLETPGADWPDIEVWGVVLGGAPRPLSD